MGGSYLQIFLLKLPIGLSFSSRTMQTSSMRRICSSSCPSIAELEVSMSGNRRRMLSAVIGSAVAVVVEFVAAIVLVLSILSKDEKSVKSSSRID